MSKVIANGGQVQMGKEKIMSCFQMPLHYPRYTPNDYKTMPEWKLDCLLREYGLPVTGDVGTKRNFAMGAFLWSGHWFRGTSTISRPDYICTRWIIYTWWYDALCMLGYMEAFAIIWAWWWFFCVQLRSSWWEYLIYGYR